MYCSIFEYSMEKAAFDITVFGRGFGCIGRARSEGLVMNPFVFIIKNLLLYEWNLLDSIFKYSQTLNQSESRYVKS